MQIPPEATRAAFSRLSELNALAHPGQKKCLRIAIVGGGCSGFSYEISLVAQPEHDDFVLESGGQVILVDPVSMPFLSGARIDFEDGLAMRRFVVINPNAVSSCGCGISVSF